MEEHLCRVCGVVLTNDNCHKGCFNSHNWICKSCRREKDKIYYGKVRDRQIQYQRERMRKIKRWAVEYLDGKCEKCGYNKNISAFDFHHDGNKNDPRIRTELLKWFKTKFIPKYIHLLCANCHREEYNPELTIHNI